MPAFSEAAIRARLRDLARQYPEPLVPGQLQDVPRIAFHLKVVLDRVGEGGRIADIGGGLGMFSLGAQALGRRAVLVDDFSDPVNAEQGEAALAPHRKLGVEILSRDVIERGVEFAPASLQAVTSFDSMEHWHHSPKKLFRQLIEALTPAGWFLLVVPNCVNLRKRLTVPLGRGSWSSMEVWYEAERFRGHVREPDLRDLRYIARDLGLAETRIFGRNWLGRDSHNPLIRALTAVTDMSLRLWPPLCSDIYLLGRKRGSS